MTHHWCISWAKNAIIDSMKMHGWSNDVFKLNLWISEPTFKLLCCESDPYIEPTESGKFRKAILCNIELYARPIPGL